MKKTIISISFDDIDYPMGGCTTHLTGLFLIELMKRKRIELADYPGLVRLNPAIPWKTRGNAATLVRLVVNSYDDSEDIFEIAKSLVTQYCYERKETQKGPGIVMVVGKAWEDPHLRIVYRRAVHDVVTKDLIEKVLDKVKAKKWGNRGVIGATAALAALAPGDPYTFELIAYRKPELWGTKRCLYFDAFWRVEAKLPPCVFNNYDILKRKVSAAPQGPDPILAGFRGTCPGYLKCYKEVLCEEPHFWLLYRTNQHTDQYNIPTFSFRPYKSGSIKGTVISDPLILQGSHVLVRLMDKRGRKVNVLFFRETGPLKETAMHLRSGDEIEVVGSFRPFSSSKEPVFAADKLHIMFVSRTSLIKNPRCPRCGARMESDGKMLRCPRCGFKLPKHKIVMDIPRTLKPVTITAEEGQWRHLLMPTFLYTPRLIKLPIKINNNQIVSLGFNPPVIDPSISCGEH